MSDKKPTLVKSPAFVIEGSDGSSATPKFTLEPDPKNDPRLKPPSPDKWRKLTSWQWPTQIYRRSNGQWSIHGMQIIGKNMAYYHKHTADTLDEAIELADAATLRVMEHEAEITAADPGTRLAKNKRHPVRFPGIDS